MKNGRTSGKRCLKKISIYSSDRRERIGSDIQGI
jgi:hypothetical protein